MHEMDVRWTYIDASRRQKGRETHRCRTKSPCVKLEHMQLRGGQNAGYYVQ